MSLLPTLQQTAVELEETFDLIPASRKELLNELSRYIRAKQQADAPLKLVFICTHNSRRSHMAQLWAQAAAAYYGLWNVQCYSGGTETTAFNPRAVKAMGEAGFAITVTDQGENPRYEASYAMDAAPAFVWSKRFDDTANPSSGFAAVMTCSEADENCPYVPGVEQRIGITYEDPKLFDGTPQEAEKYLERARQIGREMLYACKGAL